MNQYDLNRLLEKYLEGTCTPDEREQVERWSASQPDYTMPLNEPDRADTAHRLWVRIRQTTQPSPFLRVQRNPWRWVGAAAASVAVGWMVAGYLLRVPSGQDASAEQAAVVSDVEMRNTSGKVQSLRLQDGSLVLLQPGAKLAYPTQFRSRTRQVYLTGEARFDIRRDPNRPFTVHTGPLTTEVLGTSFIIRSPEQGQAIQVAVLSGKVSVYENGGPSAQHRDAAILTPNQQATFYKESGELVPGVVEKPRIVTETDGQAVNFSYSGTPLPSLLRQLSSLYGLEILMESDAMHPCTFTGDLNGLTLFEQLDLICRTLNARYEIRGTNVFIRGEGCP